MDHDNFYTILNSTKSATYEELKQNYQHLIREHHPDKQNDVTKSDKFLVIDQAWKVLRDSKSRKEYDNFLLQESFEGSVLVHAEVARSELNFSNNMAEYPCRCGSCFVVYKHYLDGGECVVECSECSNCIVVK